MKNIGIALITGIIFNYVIYPLFITYIFCDRVNVKNIKKIYSIIFRNE
jgi:hypothetical protein